MAQRSRRAATSRSCAAVDDARLRSPGAAALIRPRRVPSHRAWRVHGAANRRKRRSGVAPDTDLRRRTPAGARGAAPSDHPQPRRLHTTLPRDTKVTRCHPPRRAHRACLLATTPKPQPAARPPPVHAKIHSNRPSGSGRQIRGPSAFTRPPYHRLGGASGSRRSEKRERQTKKPQRPCPKAQAAAALGERCFRGSRLGEIWLQKSGKPLCAIECVTGAIPKKNPAATYSPTRKPCSTIGSGGLDFRVRDGNG
jgi:hypothetical protein